MSASLLVIKTGPIFRDGKVVAKYRMITGFLYHIGTAKFERRINTLIESGKKKKRLRHSNLGMVRLRSSTRKPVLKGFKK